MAALQSMTGFARLSGQAGDTEFVVEMKSVNGRGLEVRSRLPVGMDRLERPLRDILGKWLKRGNVQLQVTAIGGVEANAIRLDEELLGKYVAAARAAALAHDLAPPTIDALMALPGVVSKNTSGATLEPEALDELVLGLAERVAQGLQASRLAEGQHLAVALATHLEDIERLTSEAEAQAATQPGAIKARLEAQLADILKDKAGTVSPERLAQEVAMLAVKADVREEIDRLRAHVAEARKLLKTGEGVGRRLDFLAQEFNREANTLCSKSTDVELTRLGLDLKTSVDRLREQVQNVE